MTPFQRARGCTGLILMYHRVVELESDPWSIAVSPTRFAEHLELIRKYAKPRPLAQVVAALQHGESCDGGALIVTFDDGYADNLHTAAPLLEHYETPATMFLTTGCIGAPREFWWDQLERVCLEPATLPAELRLIAAGRPCDWSLGQARHYTKDERRGDHEWATARRGAPSRRLEFYRAVHRVLQPLEETERNAALDVLSRWADVPISARESHRCLSQQEVKALAAQELFEPGSHTVTHPALSTLSGASQRLELRQSKLELEQLLERPVTSLAYPYGSFAEETIQLAKEAGFSSACSTRSGALNEEADLLCLPRIKVGNWRGEQMEEFLAGWFPN